MVNINPKSTLQNRNILTICCPRLLLVDRYEDDEGFSKLCEWSAREGPLGQTVNYLSSPSGKCSDLPSLVMLIMPMMISADHHRHRSTTFNKSLGENSKCLGFSVHVDITSMLLTQCSQIIMVATEANITDE